MKVLLSNKKLITILSVLVVAVAGVGLGVYARHSTRPEETVAKKTEGKESKTEVVDIPTFTDCYLEGESIEKDLTLIMKGADQQKVSGVSFQVKLVPADKQAEVADSVQKIADVDAKITETKMAEAEGQGATQSDGQISDVSELSGDMNQQTSDKTDSAKETSKQKKVEVSSVTGEALSPLEQLYIEKKEAIAAYTEVLNTVDAQTYSDDDSDGMIYIESIDPGDYVACYIPTEGNDYSATDYAVAVNVKDKIEYKAVKNIADKTVSAAAAGDVQGGGRNVPVEATPSNTVKFIESHTETRPAEYSQVATPIVEATVGGVADVPSTDGVASVGINQTATLYSGVNNANVVGITVQTSGLSGEPQVISDNGLVSVSGTAGMYTLTAGNTGSDVAVTVTVSGTSTTGLPLSANCSVVVVGVDKVMTTSDGQKLYVDTNGTEATYRNYNPSGTYYIRTKEAETIYYGWQEIDGYRYYFDENGNKVTGTQVINGATYNFGSDGVLLTSGFGIDVSKWQGNIDWTQASSAVSFAIIRCGFRGSSGNIAVDPKFAQNIQGAKTNGVRVGVYFYSIAMNEAQAVEEASLAVQQVSQYGGVSLPIYIDMEDSRQLSLSQAERDAIVMAFCRTVQNSGYMAGVYANKNWLTNYLTPSSYGGISIWVAQYNTQCTYKGRYDIWQYSSKGSIPGISGNVDLNTSYF